MLNFNLKIVQKRGYKNLRMSFKDSSTLLISAPKHLSKKKCLEFVEQNRTWVEEQQKLWEQRLSLKLPCNQIFLFGEWQDFKELKSFKNLEKSKNLKRQMSFEEWQSLGAQESSAKIQSSWIQSLHHTPTKTSQKTLLNFYRQELDSYLQAQIPLFASQMNLHPNKILYGKSYKQLACCYHKTKNLRFSLRLAFMPKWLIDSIIIHELAHIRYPNHQKDFWNLVTTHDKNPKKVHLWLKEHQDLLLLLHQKILKS